MSASAKSCLSRGVKASASCDENYKVTGTFPPPRVFFLGSAHRLLPDFDERHGFSSLTDDFNSIHTSHICSKGYFLNLSDPLLASGQLFEIACTHGFPNGTGLYMIINDHEACTARVRKCWDDAEERRAINRVRGAELADERRRLVFDYDALVNSIGEMSERSHREGLLGEILAEVAITDCSPSTSIIFVNYHRSGTPTRPGIDLAGFTSFNDQLWILLVESKFTEQGTSHIINLKDDALVSISERCESELNFAQVVFQVIYYSSEGDPIRDIVSKMKEAFRYDRILAYAFLSSDHPEMDWGQFIRSPPSTLFTLADFRSSLLKIEPNHEIVKLLDRRTTFG